MYTYIFFTCQNSDAGKMKLVVALFKCNDCVMADVLTLTERYIL